MVYGIKRGVEGRVVYYAIVVRTYCNSVANTGRGGSNRMPVVRKSLVVKEYLVKVKLLGRVRCRSGLGGVLCGTVFSVSVVVGAAVPAAVCR